MCTYRIERQKKKKDVRSEAENSGYNGKYLVHDLLQVYIVRKNKK